MTGYNFLYDVFLFCLTVVYDDLPQAGPTATRGSVSLKGENVTLTMYAVYNQQSAFRLCLYNKSTSNSCCICDSRIQCKWGELSSTGGLGNSSCQFTTSHPAVYQFQIWTSNYQCYFDIGESIDVVDDSLPSSHDQLKPILIVAYCVGGLLVLLLAVALTVIMYLVCRLHQRPQARLGKDCLLIVDVICIHELVHCIPLNNVYIL